MCVCVCVYVVLGATIHPYKELTAKRHAGEEHHKLGIIFTYESQESKPHEVTLTSAKPSVDGRRSSVAAVAEE